MNKKKTLFIGLILTVSISFALTFFAELYTQQTIDSLAGHVAQQTIWGSQWTEYELEKVGTQPALLHLGSLLYANIHANKPADAEWWGAGDYTNESYKKGWRSWIATNPALAYAALTKFGPTFFKALEEKMELKKQDIISTWDDGAFRAPILNKYSRTKYWADQGLLFDRYTTLIDKMLLLPDSKLNNYIASMATEIWMSEEPSELHTWLFQNKLINKLPQDWQWGEPVEDGAWNYSYYPVDFLFLTYRMNQDYPTWTPRKFLTEVKKFAAETKKILPS